MNPLWTEGKLEFDFSGATATDQPEKKASPLKCVDFWVQYPGELWLIEVKDQDYIPPGRSLHNVTSYGQKIRSGDVVKEELLPKLYGTFAYLADIEKEPRGEVYYGVVIGMTGLTAKECRILTDEVQRIVNRIGPKIRHSRHWPVVEVHNVASWNTAHPGMAITRHP